MFNDCIQYFERQNIDTENFERYKKIIKHLKQKDFGWEPRWSERVYQNIKWANQYEKDTIYPNLTPSLKKRFTKSKAVIKYVDLKIEGEYLGGLLNHLRAEMYSEMIKNSNINKIVADAEKKTLCFSIYKDVLDTAAEYFKHNNFDPIVISGDDDAKIKVDEFKNSAAINPLIASIKKLSTGVTIIEANTVIFLSPPWRDADLEQAEDRVHRIGQTENVHIYNLILETDYPNLSTRIQDIIEWSREMVKIAFDEI
jgi:SNF2 family DNA or RNA helicase